MSQQISQPRDAVIRGHKIELIRALERDSSIVHEADSDGVTLLMDAAANNHINILTMLLEYKASVDPINRLGRSVLMEAACRGHPAITLRLCQARPNLNYQNKTHPLNLSSLMEASSRGHAGVAFWLCEAKADINLRNSWGDTALILASHNNRFETVKILVAQGANLDIKGATGRTALETAIERGHTRVVNFLTKDEIKDQNVLNEMCQKIKAEQKQVLQDEVNYDASVLSRKIKPSEVYDILPAFREDFLDIPIPYNRGINSIEYHELQEKFEKSSQNGPNGPNSSSSGQNGPQMAPFGLIPSLYPTPPFKFDPMRHVPRKKPFMILPKFGSCSWIALAGRRVHGANSSRSRSSRADEHNQALKNNDSPMLTIFDNGYWTYRNDLVSGNLEGTFTIHLAMTHGTLSHVTNTPAEPLLVDDDKFHWVVVSDLKSIGENEEVREENGKTYKKIPMPRFDPEYNPNTYQHSYLIQLRTGGETDGDAKCQTPLQIVDCYLGKQVVLGQLIMEMADFEAPWWRYCDENEDRVEWHQYQLDRDAHERYELEQQQQE